MPRLPHPSGRPEATNAGSPTLPTIPFARYSGTHAPTSIFPLKSTHKPVKAYYDALAQFQKHGHTTEGNTRSAFADLLKKCCSPYGWHLVEEYHFKGTNKQPLRADGALIDELTLQHGIWEAKDTADDLQKEIKSKVAKGYPFSSPPRAQSSTRTAASPSTATSPTPKTLSKSCNSSSTTSRPTSLTEKMLMK